VWQEGAELYRDFPWRKVSDPYLILVSEVMLQQTQVARVLNYWEPFCVRFPTLDALAATDNAAVLEQWQGLGYNRRALALKRCAEICSERYQGILPETEAELLALPGIGAASAAGIRAFAFQYPGIYLETNVRAVFIHEFFPDVESVSDKEIMPLVEATCSQDNPRGWYYSLLDIGAHLKQQVQNPSRKSAHYARQSTFVGSRRQKRAELLRQVLAFPGIDSETLYLKLCEFEKQAGREIVSSGIFESLIEDMLKEGFFRKEGEKLFVT